MAIELDGGQHGEMQIQDNLRAVWLEAQGWEVVRFWNNEVLRNIEGVLEKISGSVARLGG